MLAFLPPPAASRGGLRPPHSARLPCSGGACTLLHAAPSPPRRAATSASASGAAGGQRRLCRRPLTTAASVIAVSPGPGGPAAKVEGRRAALQQLAWTAGALVAFAPRAAAVATEGGAPVPFEDQANGFRVALPPGWVAEEAPATPQSKGYLVRPAAGAGEVEGGAQVTIDIRPVSTMGQGGLASFGSSLAYGEVLAASLERRGRLQTELLSSGDRGQGKYYSYEVQLLPVGKAGGRAKRIWGVTAIGLGGTEAARKYNLLQQITVTATAELDAAGGGAGGEAMAAAMRALCESFELTQAQ